ncbi:hypothetical protein [Ferrovibrio sp.]|uniref:hypothetical protein n=1 Tax=Ferrovibrio sp. TaxID=1917215 RepID=UPI00311F3336
MWEVVILVCLLGKTDICPGRFEDEWGPYKSVEACMARRDEMVEIIRTQMPPPFPAELHTGCRKDEQPKDKSI